MGKLIILIKDKYGYIVWLGSLYFLLSSQKDCNFNCEIAFGDNKFFDGSIFS